jgi:hypothetical protein
MSTPRNLKALAVVAALLVTPALALPSRANRESRPVQTEAASHGFFSDVWQLLTRLWGDSGMTIDPNGAPTAASDSGGSIDPWGHPTSTPSGPSIDPNGGATTNGDSGMSLDPWG